MSAPFVAVDLHRVANVLDGLAAEIERLGERLCSDPAVLHAHMAQLQAIDRIAQHQHALASVLRAECMTTAANMTGLEDLEIQLLGGCSG